MDTEDAVYADFENHRCTRMDAINRLIALGYLEDDALAVVDEWSVALSVARR